MHKKTTVAVHGPMPASSGAIVIAIATTDAQARTADAAEQVNTKLFVRGSVRKYEALVKAVSASLTSREITGERSVDNGASFRVRDMCDRWEGLYGPLNVRKSAVSTREPSTRRPSRFDVYTLASERHGGADTESCDDQSDHIVGQDTPAAHNEQEQEQEAQDVGDTQHDAQEKLADHEYHETAKSEAEIELETQSKAVGVKQADEDGGDDLVERQVHDDAETEVEASMTKEVKTNTTETTKHAVDSTGDQDRLQLAPVTDIAPTPIPNAEAETDLKTENETQPEGKEANIAYAWISLTMVWVVLSALMFVPRLGIRAFIKIATTAVTLLLALTRQFLVVVFWGKVAMMLTEVVALVVAITVVICLLLDCFLRGLAIARRVCIVCTPLILALVRGGSAGANLCARFGIFTMTKTWACARIAYPHVMAAWRWATGFFRTTVQATATSLKQWSHELWFWLEVAFVMTWLLSVIVVQLYRSNCDVVVSAKIKTQQGYAVKPLDAFLEKPCARDAGCGSETSETEIDTSSDVESDDGMEIEVEIEMETKIEIEIDIQTGPPTQTEMKTVNEVKTDLARLPQPPTPVQTADTGSTNANAEPKPKEGESESESESETDVHVEVVPVALPSDQHAALGREARPIDTVVRSTLSAASVSVCADVVEATIQMGEASVELLSDSTLVPMSMSAVALFSSPVVDEAPLPSTSTLLSLSVGDGSLLVSNAASVLVTRSPASVDAVAGEAGADIETDATAPVPVATPTYADIDDHVPAPASVATEPEAVRVSPAPRGVIFARRAPRTSVSTVASAADSVSPTASTFLRRGAVKKLKPVKSVREIESRYLDYPNSEYYKRLAEGAQAIRGALSPDSTDARRWR